MRKKLPNELKKQKISICLDVETISKLDVILKETKQSRSKYLQNLINKELNERIPINTKL